MLATSADDDVIPLPVAIDCKLKANCSGLFWHYKVKTIKESGRRIEAKHHSRSR